jgi:DNA-binding transcriptional ArsR family regulator
MSPATRTNPQIEWDTSSGYDLFVSLWSLYSPLQFSLRGRWARGMRSRLPKTARHEIETWESLVFDKRPTHWVYTVPAPRDGAAVIAALRVMPAEKRLPTLGTRFEVTQEPYQQLARIAERGRWTQTEYKVLRASFSWYFGEKPSAATLKDMLNMWANAGEHGEAYLASLEAYYDAFYQQEERRIQPYLVEAQARAEAFAQDHTIHELMLEFTKSVTAWRVDPDVDSWVLAPSFYVSPYIFTTLLDRQRRILLFGAQEGVDAAAPGELAPDTIVLPLKALADPARLRIIQLLAESARHPGELASLLHLRPATITHHLNVLRDAGLVNPGVRQGKEWTYTARTEALEFLYAAMRRFIESK